MNHRWWIAFGRPRHRRAAVLAAVLAAVALVASACSSAVPGSAGLSPVEQDAATSTSEADTGADGPGASEPASSEPASSEPASSEPASSGPASSEPDSSGPASSGPDSSYLAAPENVDTTWDVVPKEDAVILDYAFADDAVQDFDASSGRWAFDAGAFGATGLAVGDAMLVAGRGLGRITAIDGAGDTTTVRTSEASLADVIESGTMAWDAELGFGEQWMVPSDEPTGFRSPRLAGVYVADAAGELHEAAPVVTAAGIEWGYSEGGTSYKFGVTPGRTQTQVKVQVSRDGLTFTADGTVGSLRSTGSAQYSNGKLVGSTVRQNGLGGSLTLSLAAAGSGHGELNLTVPGLMFKFVVPVGPVPVTVGISAQVIGSVDVPVKASAVFESRFSYSGEAGFRYNGSDIDASAQLGRLSMDPEAADPASMIGATVDAQFGVAFPRVSVSIFEIGLVPYIQPGLTIGTSMTWGPACKRAYIRANVTAGYDFSVLGVELASDKTELWKKKRETKADGCP